MAPQKKAITVCETLPKRTERKCWVERWDLYHIFHEFSAMFSLQPLALTVVGGKNIFSIQVWGKSFDWRECILPACKECPNTGLKHYCWVFPSRALHCLKHQCSAVLADLKPGGLQRAQGCPPSWKTLIFLCKCKDLQFVSSVLFCICFGGSSEILTPGKGVRESQRKGSVLLPLYMSQKAEIFRR